MKLRVLVVDDEETIRTIFSQVLEEDGYEVTEAASGEEALEIFRRELQPIVLADILMEGMSGIQLLQEIKQINPDTQVIIITSHASLDSSITALRAGAYDYLQKPVDELDAISNTVARAADKIRLINENRSLVAQLSSVNDELKQSNETLQQLATRDGLTGLYNHRFFQESLALEMSHSKRHNLPFSLLFMDVDFFKKFNDTNGHPMGDSLLKGLSKIIQGRMRGYDIVSRYGGEEFVVIMPKTLKNDALVVAEYLRQEVAAFPFEGRENMPDNRVTISIGVASFPEDGADAAALLLSADQALYKAKHEGRNKVCTC
jgi:diguanylate cyclase (GGDEF)-like protein